MVANFFEQQALARRRTSQLVFLYCCAVVAIILSVYAVVYCIWFFGAQPPQIFDSVPSSVNKDLLPRHIFEARIFLQVAFITGGMILMGTLYKMASLKSGGKVVAENLGGNLIDPSTTNLNEKKAFNVVEEMAIASGVPVPPVYLLSSEDGINAFAAGYSPSDAVIGLTKGCITKLKREELQGVVGHEFSHILNGDMRLNLKLIGVLHGILLLGLIGEGLIRVSGNSREKKGTTGALLFTGFGLLVIGYIGVFFGKLIKSAVSRQREYLADAASVQFTRNPDGLAGALKKIAGLPAGSALDAGKAAEASHLFFADGLSRSFLNLFATHPPIFERIKRIEPSFNENLFNPAELEQQIEKEESAEASLASGSGSVSGELKKTQTPVELLQSVGTMSLESVEAAASIILSFDNVIRSATRNELGARAIVLALIMESNAGRRQPAREDLASNFGMDLANAVEKLLPYLHSVEPMGRLPLIDMCMPSLKRLSQNEYFEFKKQLFWLIESDKTISFFEYGVRSLVCRTLDEQFVGRPKARGSLNSLEQIMPQCIDLLSHLAMVGGGSRESHEKALSLALEALEPGTKAPLPDPHGLSLARVDESLKAMDIASFELKEKILNAAAICIAADGVLNPNEMALIRAIGSRLGCPVPLPGCPRQ